MTHPDEQLLYAYGDLSVHGAAAASVEAHLVACADCRAVFARHARGAAGEAERIWSGILDQVDRPRVGVVERALRRVGAPESTTRILAATPALRLAWLVAVAVLIAFATVAARAEGDPFVLLVIAPIVPVAGVATAFGPWLDPTYELGVAAPFSGARLVLLRSAAVLLTGFPLLVGASAFLPGGWEALAWVLPAVALTALSLAASTWVSPERAGAVVSVAWLAGVVLTLRHPGADLAERSLAFRPLSQLLALVVGVAAALVIARRRHHLDAVAYH